MDNEEEIKNLIASLGTLGGAAKRVAENLETDSKKQTRQTKDLTDSQKDLIKEVDKYLGVVKRAGGEFMKFTNGTANAAMSTASSSKAFESVIPTMNLINTTFQQAIKIVTDLTGSIGGLAGIIAGKFTGAVGEAAGAVANFAVTIISHQLKETQRLIDTQASLSKSGLVFAGSLDYLNNVAKEGGMSIDTFAKFAGKNGEKLASLGLNAEMGALKVIGLSKAIGDTEYGLRTIYGGFEGFNDAMLGYLEDFSRFGVNINLRNAELTNGAADYLKVQKALTILTGKSAEELRKQQEEAAKDAAFQDVLRSMDVKQREKINLALATMGEEEAKLFQESLVAAKNGTQALSQSFLMASAAAPNMVNGITDVATNIVQNGTKQSNDEFVKQYGEHRKRMDAEGKAMYESQKGTFVLMQQGYARNIPYLELQNKLITEQGRQVNRNLNFTGSYQDAMDSVGKAQNEQSEMVDDANKALEAFKRKMDDITINNLPNVNGQFQALADITMMLFDAFSMMLDGTNWLLEKLGIAQGPRNAREREAAKNAEAMYEAEKAKLDPRAWKDQTAKFQFEKQYGGSKEEYAEKKLKEMRESQRDLLERRRTFYASDTSTPNGQTDPADASGPRVVNPGSTVPAGAQLDAEQMDALRENNRLLSRIIENQEKQIKHAQ